MKQFKTYVVIILLLTVLIVPSVALAAWWNPFTWNWNIFNIFSKPQTSVAQPNQNTNQKQVKNTTTQTPTDQTAGWKTYASPSYGFEFKYPSPTYEAACLNFSNPCDTISVGWMTMHIGDNSSQQSLKDYIATQKSIVQDYSAFIWSGRNAMKFSQPTTINFVGKEAVVYRFELQGSDYPWFGEIYYIRLNDKVLYIDYVLEETADNVVSSTEKTILSTFKFTK